MTNPGDPPPERPAPGRGPVQLQISRKSHDDLTRIKTILGDELGRSVTFAEVVERLIEHWETS